MHKHTWLTRSIQQHTALQQCGECKTTRLLDDLTDDELDMASGSPMNNDIVHEFVKYEERKM